MILQSLAAYYKRMVENGDTGVAPEGFEKKEIPFLVVLNAKGEFLGLQDTREGEGKKKSGRLFLVPKGVKKTSGIAANLLWDNPAYLFARPKPDPTKDPEKLVERAKAQQQCFLAVIKEKFPEPIQDDGIQAVLAFLEKGGDEALFVNPAWKEIEESGANLTFKLDRDSCLVCQRPAVKAAVTSLSETEHHSEGGQMCLVTGEHDIPARLHTSIKGVWGAQPAGANIVSFNLDAFRSFGKEQGLNAPVGKRTEFAYTTALNTLLAKGSRQRLQVGDTSTIFWGERWNKLEDIFADLFGEPVKENPNQLNAAVKSLYEAPKSGELPLEEDYSSFYVLGLAPNIARISVRFWHAGTVGETACHIRQHFDDCSIIHAPHQPEHLSLFRLLISTAMLGKSENIQPSLAADLLKAAMNGSPYPHTLLSSAIRRCRAEREIAYPRAAVIKAVLSRNARFYNQTEKEVGMALDPANTSMGYLLGRLFSVLEHAQETASPGLNATIRDRFYGAASSTPVAVFPHLMKLKNHHITKIDNRGLAVNLEKQIGEIMSGLQDFPAHLGLQDQGRFAIGYYHQRQAFFTKKQKDEGPM